MRVRGGQQTLPKAKPVAVEFLGLGLLDPFSMEVLSQETQVPSLSRMRQGPEEGEDNRFNIKCSGGHVVRYRNYITNGEALPA